MTDTNQSSRAALLRQHRMGSPHLASGGHAEGGAGSASSDVTPSWPSATLAWTQAPFIALQFLTVLPPIVRRPPRPDDLGRSEAFFPLVGLVLGAVLALLDLAVAPYLAPLVRDVVVVALLATMTGALHLDGVIDTFDGLFSGRTSERRLEVMRDPRAGSYGVVAITLLLLLKVAALGALPPATRPVALVLAPALGRWGIVLATGAFAYVRLEGMGRDFKDSIRWPHLVIGGIIALGAAAVLAGAPGVIIWTGGSLAVLGIGQWVTGRLGGLSGDIYGAICEIVETGALVLLGLHIWSLFG